MWRSRLNAQDCSYNKLWREVHVHCGHVCWHSVWSGVFFGRPHAEYLCCLFLSCEQRTAGKMAGNRCPPPSLPGQTETIMAHPVCGSAGSDNECASRDEQRAEEGRGGSKRVEEGGARRFVTTNERTRAGERHAREPVACRPGRVVSLSSECNRQHIISYTALSVVVSTTDRLVQALRPSLRHSVVPFPSSPGTSTSHFIKLVPHLAALSSIAVAHPSSVKSTPPTPPTPQPPSPSLIFVLLATPGLSPPVFLGQQDSHRRPQFPLNP